MDMQAFRSMGSMWPIKATTRICALNLITHAFDVVMMVSYKTVKDGRCEHRLFIMIRGKYDGGYESEL